MKLQCALVVQTVLVRHPVTKAFTFSVRDKVTESEISWYMVSQSDCAVDH